MIVHQTHTNLMAPFCPVGQLHSSPVSRLLHPIQPLMAQSVLSSAQPNANANSRLLKEYREVLKGRAAAAQAPTTKQDIALFPPDESNLHLWHAHILGPPDSPYENHYFTLRIQVPSQYPLAPPKVVFITKTGEICLDVLKDAWTPIWTLESTCRAIIALLGAPDATSPLNCDAGNLIRAGDTAGFENLARMYTLDHASTTLPPITSKASAGV